VSWVCPVVGEKNPGSLRHGGPDAAQQFGIPRRRVAVQYVGHKYHVMSRRHRVPEEVALNHLYVLCGGFAGKATACNCSYARSFDHRTPQMAMSTQCGH
jgi:hypothetical protein